MNRVFSRDCVLTSLFFSLSLTASYAQDGEVSASLAELASEPVAASVSTMLRVGDDVTDTAFQATVPLISGGNDDWLLFVDTALNQRNIGDQSFSVGLGARILMEDLGVITGFRVHGDVTETQFDNQLKQLGFGFDLLTDWGFDIHANYYLPEDQRKMAREFRNSAQSQQQDTYQITQLMRTDAPQAQGHEIVQNRVYDERTLGRTTTTDITQVFQQFEAGRQGGDLRAAFNLPGLEAIRGRATVGAYHYEGTLGQGELTGLMGGLTISPLRGVSVGAEYYEDEDLFGSNWVGTAGVTLEVSSFENLINPSKWGEGLARAFGPNREENSELPSRMLIRAPRHQRVLVELSDPVEDLAQREMKTTVREETISARTVEVSETLASNVIFVNNGSSVGNGIEAGAASGNGTAENPVDTIQKGAGLLAPRLGGSGTVYVQAGTYAETDIEVGHGAGVGAIDARIMSSSQGIPARSGFIFGGDTGTALIPAGGFDVRGGTIGSTQSVRISGFEIVGGISNNPPPANVVPGTGISAVEVASVVIDSNDIHDAVIDGVAIDPGALGVGGTQVEIFNNRIADSGFDGIFLDGDLVGFVRNNDITGNVDDGINIENDNRGNIASNTFSDNSWGVFIRNENAGSISRNQITDNAFDGIWIDSGSNTGRIDFNMIEDNGLNGILLTNDNSGRIASNTITGSLLSGVTVGNDNSGIIENNNISDNGLGISILNANSGDIQSNQISDNLVDGIWIDGGDNTGNITSNFITNNGLDGIIVDNNNFGTISSNFISGNGDDGIEVGINNVGLIESNEIVDNNWGINIVNDNFGSIDSNTIRDNTVDGILVFNDNQGSISQNTVTGNGDDGIEVFNNNLGNIDSNTLTGNAYGLFIGFDNLGHIGMNIATNSIDDGILILNDNFGTIRSNTISDNGRDGIAVFGTNAATGTFDSNTAERNGDDGFEFLFFNIGNFTNNAANDNIGAGYERVNGAAGVVPGNTSTGNGVPDN